MMHSVRHGPPTVLIAIAVVLATPAFAGAEFTAVTRNQNPGSRLPAVLGDATVRGRVDGDHGRIEFLKSGIGNPASGSVIVTADGARTATLFDVVRHACGDAPTPAAASGGMRAQAASPVKFDNLTVDKTLDEPGPKRFGLATRHLRYAISYDVRPGAGSANMLHAAIQAELWVAPKLTDAAYALWLQPVPHTGNADADRRIAAQMGDVAGAALERIQRTTLQAGPAAALTTTSKLAVTRLAMKKPGASALAPPFACRTKTLGE